MKRSALGELSRRERQIMNIIIKKREVSAADVHQALPDRPSYSTVRALLAILEKKGYIGHRRDGRAYLYSPRIDRDKAGAAALKNVVHTFFDDSVEDVVAALMSMKSTRMSEDEYDRLAELIRRSARATGKRRK